MCFRTTAAKCNSISARGESQVPFGLVSAKPRTRWFQDGKRPTKFLSIWSLQNYEANCKPSFRPLQSSWVLLSLSLLWYSQPVSSRVTFCGGTMTRMKSASWQVYHTVFHSLRLHAIYVLGLRCTKGHCVQMCRSRYKIQGFFEVKPWLVSYEVSFCGPGAAWSV